MANILVCDDEKNLRQLLCMALESNGHQTLAAANGAEALKILNQMQWDLLITDLKLPDSSGLELLRQAKILAPERPALLITAFASATTAVIAMKEGAFDYLEKPFAMEDLHLSVARALEQGALKQENVRLRQVVGEHSAKDAIIGVSPAMRQILELAKRAARSDASVLITGESGTGKELLARFIHAHSMRSLGPFVAINCGAVPETLIESELFGHVKGAFTGAASHRSGLFVEADNGTLLLDEIGETPLSLQVKLLRVLQERTIRPVGGTGERAINVRLLTATNRNLLTDETVNPFREDLLYRINVINLHIPPLRQRKEDIPLLTTWFVEKYSRRYGMTINGLAPKVIESLTHYSFPGNVRELENIIEGAVALTMEGRIEMEALPIHIQHPDMKKNISFQLPKEGLNLETYLTSIETQAIEQALSLCNGSKTKAAELLGMSFRTLRYRMTKIAPLTPLQAWENE